MNAKVSRLLLVIAPLYCLTVLSQTLGGGSGLAFDFRGEVNLVPLGSLVSSLTSSDGPLMEVKMKYLLGNLAMFGPLGAYLAYARRHIGTAAAWVGGISMTLEGLQFAMVGYRSADIDDVILNTGGAIIAFVAWRLLRLPRSSPGPRSSPEPLAP